MTNNGAEIIDLPATGPSPGLHRGRLADGRMTLDELIADLQAQFPSQAEAGELPSRAAVHRYGQKLERRLAAIRASTEAAKLIRAQAGDDLDARSARR
ncbi:DUF3486 family protein [Pseudomonas aeruginosa]|nr:DUF3486 family protein [Pseudomonas aeruginosa]